MGAGIWAAAGAKGLWQGALGGPWRRADSPPMPIRLAQGAGRVVGACAGGEVFDVQGKDLLDCPGVEAMALSPDGSYLYLLSAETDSVLCCRADTGEMLFLNRAGAYPRDMRLDTAGRLMAVAGGAAGEVMVFSAPDLKLIRRFAVPGIAYQAAFMPGGLAVMLAAEDGQVFTLLGEIRDRRGSFQELARLPGLPGALCPCADGTLAAGTLEHLIRLRWQPFKVLWQYQRTGLPGHLCEHPRGLLLSDSLMGRALLVTGPGREQTIFEAEDIFAQWQV
ncbi:MAG: beta-propeller fold lactonase family protein [Clostridia bacterium]|nr:beta-propeller fold lactonase family protein [Clostridia bacterium]